LVLTSPPYWTLKEYPPHDGQLGLVEDCDPFHDELDKVWKHCFRVLVPGGRLAPVVGDVCLSRRKHGRHSVMPMHADIVLRAHPAISERIGLSGRDDFALVVKVGPTTLFTIFIVPVGLGVTSALTAAG